MSFYVVGWPWWVAKDLHLCLLTLHSCGMKQKQKNSWVEINKCFVSEGRGDEVVQRQSLSTSRKHADAHPLPETSLCKHAYCWSWCYMRGNIPLISCHHLSWLSLLPASCPPSDLTIEGGRVGNGESWGYADTDQQEPEHWCVTSIVSVTKSKHS